jgi:hypothetical protein
MERIGQFGQGIDAARIIAEYRRFSLASWIGTQLERRHARYATLGRQRHFGVRGAHFHHGELGTPTPSAAAEPRLANLAESVNAPNGVSSLVAENIRLESPPPTEPPPSTLLKFDLFNRRSTALTELVLEIAVIEKREPEPSSPEGRALAGPFRIRGDVVIEPGYSIEFSLLLRNLRSGCRLLGDCRSCFRSLAIAGPVTALRLRLTQSAPSIGHSRSFRLPSRWGDRQRDSGADGISDSVWSRKTDGVEHDCGTRAVCALRSSGPGRTR